MISHRPAYAGGCDPLTTARIKLAAACATAKYSRGLLTVTSFFFTVHHRWWVRRLALLPGLSSFRSTLLPAPRGCRFRHYTELALYAASGKLAALCSFPRPHDRRRFHFAVHWSHLQSDPLPKQQITLQPRPPQPGSSATLSSCHCRPFSV